MRFLGLQLEDRVPDAKTVWLFRERLKGLNLVDVLFARFHRQLAEEGYVARAGQMIDATFVEAPRQRNTREENVQIKAGEVPEAWAKAKRRQKDTDARIDSPIREKGTRGKPLSKEQKQTNRTKSKVRARVEHVFGAQAAMGGHLVRTLGLQREKVKIGLMNLVYNRMRLVQLIKRDVKAINGVLMDNHREGAPNGV